ncbi:hypothetical protein F3Y22_tig00008262pilonHSYRG00053 [Hibiscus syriacus]|uniref:Uncharacterized protein n=1 Tax=Hibiscus syriacus TaxID=106335 RepID=A0A6A3CAT2_HIBSY|nr:hypothetical protein F3Y22_tig00008262pilonHSYRG00053 [Hibiscus syriacus]
MNKDGLQANYSIQRSVPQDLGFEFDLFFCLLDDIEKRGSAYVILIPVVTGVIIASQDELNFHLFWYAFHLHQQELHGPSSVHGSYRGCVSTSYNTHYGRKRGSISHLPLSEMISRSIEALFLSGLVTSYKSFELYAKSFPD